MSRPRPIRAKHTHNVPDAPRNPAPPLAAPPIDADRPPDDSDTHPADPTRTKSGRFKQDFVHNGAGRRGKRPKKGDTDLAALLRSIAHERIEVSHPVTGKPLTVVEGLTRACPDRVQGSEGWPCGPRIDDAHRCGAGERAGANGLG